MNCVACGNILGNPPKVRIGLARLVSCKTCGTWTYFPRPDQTAQAALHDTAEYYDHAYFELRRERKELTDRRCSDLFNRLKAAGLEVGSLKGQRVLDVGCDTGGLLLSAARQFGIVPVGVDVSERAIARASARGIETYHARLEDAPASVADFPLITAIDLIEHVTDAHGFLNAIRQRLRPGGLAYLETPNIESTVYRAGAVLCKLARSRPASLFERLFPPQHIQYFTVRSLESVVHDSGLEVVYFKIRSLPVEEIAASAIVRAGVSVLQRMDSIANTGILICLVVRRAARKPK